MPEHTDGGNKEFAALLKSSRSLEDLKLGKYTDLRGTVYRGSDANTFALATTDGNLVELETAAVDRFKVSGTGLNPEVEISVVSDSLRAAKVSVLKPIAADGHVTLFAADHKSLIKDLRSDPIADKYVIKDVHTDPIVDPINTGFADTLGGGGTAAETIAEGGIDPGQVATNPAQFAASAAGMMPFVMATPHQASAAAINMQMGAAQPMAAGLGASALTVKEVPADNTLKEIVQDTRKEVIHDTLKEVPYDTVKEVINETHKELIVDTAKEIVETIVEGGGTLQEGGGFPGAGGFPGMPGF